MRGLDEGTFLETMLGFCTGWLAIGEHYSVTNRSKVYEGAMCNKNSWSVSGDR
jgi:hypothetical protein